MYRSAKNKHTKNQQLNKASPASSKNKMAPESLEPDDTIQLSAVDPASPADSLLQIPQYSSRRDHYGLPQTFLWFVEGS